LSNDAASFDCAKAGRANAVSRNNTIAIATKAVILGLMMAPCWSAGPKIPFKNPASLEILKLL
jgi:hypothetical protein